MAGKPPENSSWSTLSTVNTFDKGNHSWTTRCMDDTDVQGGGQIVGRVAPATSLLIESLIQQLCTMFEGDPVRRNDLFFAICDRLHEMKLIDGSYNKTEFEIMRGQYQMALYKLVTVARSMTGSESPLQVPNCLMAEWSRYRREFIEIEFIANGGFGSVYKARHRLDGNEYAIKKIIVRSGRVKTIMHHLEEVKTIAKLNHSNIVSYKGAWIEQTFPATFVPSWPVCDSEKSRITENFEKNGKVRSQCSDKEDKDESTDAKSALESKESRESKSVPEGENERPSKVKSFTYKTGMYISSIVEKREVEVCGISGGYIISHDIINERFQQLNSTNNIIGQRISDRLSCKTVEEGFSDVVSFRSETCENKSCNTNGYSNFDEESDIDEINGTDDHMESDSCEEAASEQQLCKFNSSLPQQYAVLYIQMALCDRTLRQWIDERTEPIPIQDVTTIVTQILVGLEYIHSCGIVHHDIKPSNLFISNSGGLHVQLGDFGLACPLQMNVHHSMLGTPTYAAPEQLKGKCDPKSDVYSVGIVVLELLVPMQTHMERSRVISALKSGQIPTTLTTNYPEWAQMISQMVQENPKNRNSTTELLKRLNEDKESTIARLREENVQKDEMIRELLNKIATLEATIEKHKILSDNT